MRQLGQILTTFCLLVYFLTLTSMADVLAAHEEKKPTGLSAQGAILYDRQSGQFLFEQNPDQPLYPASITKVLTAILALEKGDLSAKVKTSKLAREQEGNRIYLEYDEEQTLENLLYGLMLNSGNDAAVAIAEHIGGSVEQFADMMNQKAKALGATHTHFVTPSGLHDDLHTTTARDMALISSYAMNNQTFRKIVATESLPWKGQVWESTLINLNQMLYNYEGTTGIKTGFTDQAQQTITVSAKRGDRELIAVLMGVENRPKIREEATVLLDYGFDQFVTTKLASKGDVIQSFALNATPVRATLAEDVYRTLPLESTPSPSFTSIPHINVPQAPFRKGDVVGSIDYVTDGQIIVSVDLLADNDVAAWPINEAVAVIENKFLLLFTLVTVLLFLSKRIVKFRKSRSI
ncbi:hypothetical protein CIG75_08750 [Tumebacillus algifaecis]|uniref:serine-type D-Ala-D-Ala carboxypeptidase n=1 Tax=Tumebacillus algifaecis TaxID=1214604 RepID=A0A223D088_9BACL|nr:D-alanyl-D-alanine carboxypeptidase family protein [Tumebacillus algifaecis]ASS75058.1 hypothetical protein CIG75_08750 [Tumebacillus algifaecis]